MARSALRGVVPYKVPTTPATSGREGQPPSFLVYVSCPGRPWENGCGLQEQGQWALGPEGWGHAPCTIGGSSEPPRTCSPAKETRWPPQPRASQVSTGSWEAERGRQRGGLGLRVRGRGRDLEAVPELTALETLPGLQPHPAGPWRSQASAQQCAEPRSCPPGLPPDPTTQGPSVQDLGSRRLRHGGRRRPLTRGKTHGAGPKHLELPGEDAETHLGAREA